MRDGGDRVRLDDGARRAGTVQYMQEETDPDPAHQPAAPMTAAVRAPSSGSDTASGSTWDVRRGGRTFWFSPRLNDKTLRRDARRLCPAEEANLVASRTADGCHLPAVDIDHPAALVASSTAGHWHLFIDVPMSWRAYRRLLRALYLGGVIGRNAYWRSLDRGASFVRPPGVYKTTVETGRAAAGHGTGRRAAVRALWAARLRVTLRRAGWNARELFGFVRHLRTIRR